jgi:hypothetical protein
MAVGLGKMDSLAVGIMSVRMSRLKRGTEEEDGDGEDDGGEDEDDGDGWKRSSKELVKITERAERASSEMFKEKSPEA